MTFVPQSRVLPRVLWRPAIFIFAVAQILLALAPIAEGRQGGSARAHVEEAGTTLHHAHNEADCVACVARGLLGSAELASLHSAPLASVLSGLRPATAVLFDLEWPAHTRSRAPPVLSA